MKKAHLIPVCLLAFLFFAAGCQTLAETNESARINRGWRWHRRGNYKWAISAFEYALKRNPQSADAYMGLAWTYEDMGDYDKAKEYYSKVIELDPRGKFFFDVGSNKIESAAIRRGWRHHRWAEYKQAIESFNLALKKNPKSTEAYIGLAVVWENKGDYNKAIEYFSKAIELEPKSGYFWLRGEACSEKRDFARGIEDYTSAINRDPGFAAAYTDRGSCYISLGKYETALADYQKALELIPADDQGPYAFRVRKVALKAISDLQKKLHRN